MTKVGLVLGTKLGQIAAKLCRFLINKLALSGNEAGHGFADHFENTELEVHDLNVNALQRTNFMNRNIAMLLKYTFKMYR